MTETEQKRWIDNASYEQLLFKWRFAPDGYKLFAGEMGLYFKEKMQEKKAELSHEEQVQASKNIGWTR